MSTTPPDGVGVGGDHVHARSLPPDSDAVVPRPGPHIPTGHSQRAEHGAGVAGQHLLADPCAPDAQGGVQGGRHDGRLVQDDHARHPQQEGEV